MNIFVLDSNHFRNASFHVDKHIVKMPLESAQLACTALHEYGVETPYKPTHRNHPCAIWSRQTQANFVWLCHYGLALCDEYTFRYGKRHKSADVLAWCLDRQEKLPIGELTPFAQAMPEQYRQPDALLAYRAYYITAKAHLAVWSRRDTPAWYAQAVK